MSMLPFYSGCLHKTEEILEHPITQLVMILLVFFDCGIVIAELIIDRDAVKGIHFLYYRLFSIVLSNIIYDILFHIGP